MARQESKRRAHSSRLPLRRYPPPKKRMVRRNCGEAPPGGAALGRAPASARECLHRSYRQRCGDLPHHTKDNGEHRRKAGRALMSCLRPSSALRLIPAAATIAGWLRAARGLAQSWPCRGARLTDLMRHAAERLRSGPRNACRPSAPPRHPHPAGRSHARPPQAGLPRRELRQAADRPSPTRSAVAHAQSWERRPRGRRHLARADGDRARHARGSAWVRKASEAAPPRRKAIRKRLAHAAPRRRKHRPDSKASLSGYSLTDTPL